MTKGILHTVSRNIRDRRLNLDITQEELAERAGLHRTYIGAVERSEKNATLRSLERIAAALNCSVRDLVAEQ